jgi:hypothetical protein
MFSLASVAAGAHRLLVRRVGYNPVLVILLANRGGLTTRDVVLEPLVQSLEQVIVLGASGERLPANLAGFEYRRIVGMGRFIGPAELARYQNERTGTVLAKALPGMRLQRSGGAEYVATTRATTTRAFDPDQRKACFVMVYLDGIAVYSGRDGEQLFDVNSLSVGSLSAVEYFAGPAQVPAQYNRLGSVCGVLLLWTR